MKLSCFLSGFMIDMHNHIIYGVDDGCKTIEDSIKTIRRMKQIGFNSLVFTPHYIKNTEYNANIEEKQRKLNILKKSILIENIDVNLYLGNEIFINYDIENLLTCDICTINNSRYLLIELSFNNQVKGLFDYIYELNLKGYKVIIAHPERYTYFQDNYELVKELYSQNVLFQCNYGSIINQYGKKARKLIRKMLKDELVDLLSTDIHNYDSIIFNNFEKIKHKIIKIVGQDKFEELSFYNINKIINNEEV